MIENSNGNDHSCVNYFMCISRVPWSDSWYLKEVYYIIDQERGGVVRYRTAAVKNTRYGTYERSLPSIYTYCRSRGQVAVCLWKWILTFEWHIVSQFLGSFKFQIIPDFGTQRFIFFWFKLFFRLGVEQAESRLRDGPAGDGPAVCDVPRAAPGRHDVDGGAGGGPVLPAQPGGSSRRPGPPAPAPGSQREYLSLHS